MASKRCSNFVQRIQEIYSDTIKNVTIEPFMFLHMVGYTMQFIIVQNFYIDRICRLSKNYPSDICSNLSSYPLIEKDIEATASIFTMYRNILESGPAIFFVLFLGSWSDRRGTKLPMILPISGFTLSSIVYWIISYGHNIPPELCLIASIPIALTGGLPALLLAVFAYISQITTISNRSFRIAILEFTWFLGSPLGLLGGAALFKYAGYGAVFIVALIVYGCALIFGMLYVKNNKKLVSSPVSGDNTLFSNLFNREAFVGTISTLFRHREGKLRVWVLILVLAIYLRLISLMGTLSVVYLFTRNRFGWDAQEFSQFTIFESGLSIFGGYIVLFFAVKLFQVNDALIGFYSAIGFILSSVIVAFASVSYLMYFAAVIQMFSGLITIMARSLLSKFVSSSEVGQIFSIASVGEAAMPLIANPLYNLIFASTVLTFPGAVFLITAVINIFIAACFLYLYISIKSSNYFQPVEMSDPLTCQIPLDEKDDNSFNSTI